MIRIIIILLKIIITCLSKEREARTVGNHDDIRRWVYESMRVREYESMKVRDMRPWYYETMKLWDFDNHMMSGTGVRPAIDWVREYDTVRLWDFETMRLNDHTTKRRWDYDNIRLREHETMKRWGYETMRLLDYETSFGALGACLGFSWSLFDSSWGLLGGSC